MKKIADLYAEVIGVLSQSRFHSVRKKFFLEIRDPQNSSTTIISIIEGMSFIRVKMFPVDDLEQWFTFLQVQCVCVCVGGGCGCGCARVRVRVRVRACACVWRIDSDSKFLRSSGSTCLHYLLWCITAGGVGHVACEGDCIANDRTLCTEP